MDDPSALPSAAVRVVLFSGGRGSGALTRQLVRLPNVSLTIAINGYDDGASTGEVRRFLGDALGPSDFRKNASTIARELATCDTALLDFLDGRLPPAATVSSLRCLIAQAASLCAGAGERLSLFANEITASSKPFALGDCSVGNLVFAGGFLRCGRRFNAAVDDYCELLGLPAGLIDNVTTGENAWLAAIDQSGAILPSEAALVAAGHSGHVRDIALLDRPIGAEEAAAIGQDAGRAAALFAAHAVAVAVNPRVARAVAKADLIVYAPGTQHSSLFPSYLTAGLRDAIAGNLRAIKLLVTNIQPDAEIKGYSALELIDRALFYLRDRGGATTPTPCLITHYLMNDPGRHEPERGYVPLGHLESLEDPRLVRIGDYEDGVSGRHDAARVLEPFLAALTGEPAARRAAVLLYEGGANKIAQTLLEMVRGGVERLPVTLTVFLAAVVALDPAFLASLPFVVQAMPGGEADFHAVLRGGSFDYAMLFESSGMYRGEDLVALAVHLAAGRLDAVWGSRRLSVRDIEQSYRLRYEASPLRRLISRMGSHVLSLACLLLFGRYVSDTLSGVRAARASDAAALDVPLTDKDFNHHLLARLLSRKADILELPVRFLPLSPARVHRTSLRDGLRALGIMIRSRLTSRRA